MARRSTRSARARLATNLRAARKQRGLSQEGLAELANLHRTYVGGIEREERNVSIDNIEKLAKALGLDIAELLSRWS
jgi:transcriptional regulator with XRE-family HTH domain